MEKITFSFENKETENKIEISHGLQDDYISVKIQNIIVEFYTNATIESLFKLLNNNKYGLLEGGAYNEAEMLSYFLVELSKNYTIWDIITINNSNDIKEYEFFDKYISLFDNHAMIYNKNIALKKHGNVLSYYVTSKFEIFYNMQDGTTDFTIFENYKNLDVLEYLKIIELLSKLAKKIK
jgi:hypothetical protein